MMHTVLNLVSVYILLMCQFYSLLSYYIIVTVHVVCLLCYLCSCYGPKELSKKFGRAFDVDVDVPDFRCVIRYYFSHDYFALTIL